MSIVSEAYDILFLFFAHVGSIDLLIDKQKLTKNKVLNANGLYDSDAICVGVRRQLVGKIFGFGLKTSPVFPVNLWFLALKSWGFKRQP